MLYIKQKEYVCNQSGSHGKVQDVIFALLQGIALYLIIVGFWGGLWSEFGLKMPKSIVITGESVRYIGKQLSETVSSGCSVALEWENLLKSIAICCIITTVGFSVVSKRKWQSVVAVLDSIAILFLASLHRDEIFRGARYIVESFLKLYNIYFGTNLTCMNVSDIDIIWAGEATIFMAAVLILLCGIDIFVFQSIKISIGLAAIQCAIVFIIGQVPDTLYIGEMALGIVIVCFLGKTKEPLSMCNKKGHVVLERSYGKKVGIQNVCYVVILAFCIFFAITKTVLTPCFIWFENHRDLSTIISDIGKLEPENLMSKVEDVMDSIKKEKPGEAGMGMSGGQLGQSESVKGNGETDLIVTVQSPYYGYVYLKGYVASVYEGDCWTQLSSFTSVDYDKLSSTKQLRNILKNVLGKEYSEVQVTVERVNADAKYTYIPYASIIDESKKQYYLNGWIKGDGEHIKEYTVFPLYSPSEILSAMKMMASDFRVGSLEGCSLEEMLSECLKYPKELEAVKEDFMSFIDASDQENFAVLTQRITEYLHTKATYSLSPGVTPEGRDFVEYFLTEQKKGYCVHFATSAAMLYRMCGYPTRYVEGYLAKVNSQEPTEVKNNTAHAWVEVYLEGIGWIPVDTTPGYSSENIPNNDRNESEEENTTVTEENNESISQGNTSNENSSDIHNTDKPDDSENLGNSGLIDNIGNQSGEDPSVKNTVDWEAIIQNKLLPILRKIVMGILIILSIWLIILIRSYILLNERRRRICNGSNRQIILSLYEFTCRLASKKKIFLDAEGDTEEMQKKLISYEVETLEKWKQIIQKAYFYPSPMTSKERELVMDVYQSIYEIVKSEKLGDLLLRFIYCYPKPQKKKKRRNDIRKRKEYE